MSALAELEGCYQHWLSADELYPLHVVLGGYAANMLPGDPVWPMLVGGSGYGKTETLSVISTLPKVHAVSTLSGEAALLSASPKRDRGAGATGGLLVEMGSFGVLVLKDFTSVLSKKHETRAEILAALRELHDGSWVRLAGADGGTKLSWSGKLGLITGCTTAIDRAHGVLSVMGERFVTARMPDSGRGTLGTAALVSQGHEKEMRAELAKAAEALLGDGPPILDPAELVDPRRAELVDAADVVALARSPVVRDYRGEIDLVLDPEAPTRLVKGLAQLYAGLLSVTLTEDVAWSTVTQVALDSVPKLRRLCIRQLLVTPGANTATIAKAVEHPTSTTRRALEDLTAHHVATRTAGGSGEENRWELTDHAAQTFRRMFGGAL